MKNHNEFMKEVKEASSLPAQTKKALGPESDEDISMYTNCEENVGGLEWEVVVVG